MIYPCCKKPFSLEEDLMNGSTSLKIFPLLSYLTVWFLHAAPCLELTLNQVTLGDLHNPGSLSHIIVVM